MEDSVLVDFRTYRIKPGMAQAQMDVYEKYGLATQIKHCGEPIAYLSAESGELNTLVHLWAFASAADRAERRAAMTKQPEWQVYVQKNAENGYIVDQRTSLMVPAKFAPIRR
jgi:NIPSNAP